MTTTNPCARSIEFAGEIRTFNLNHPDILSVIAGGHDLKNFALLLKMGGRPPLDGQYGSTPAACLKRFLQGEYSVSDTKNVILLGLVGGGMDVDAASALVAEHVTGQPLGANALIASEVISALFVGEQKEAA